MSQPPQSHKLTKRLVDRAEPKPRRYIVWDSELPGFGLRVEPTGHKTLVARYRAGGGRAGTLRQQVVGRYGTVTLDQGRIAARKLLGAASAGGDPIGDKKAARQAGTTVAEVCDWYLAEADVGRLLGRKGRPLKASTLATDRSRIQNHVKPLIGRRPVQSLSLHDIERMQADIAAKKTARPIAKGEKRSAGALTTGGGGVASRTLKMLQAILGRAVRHQLIETNPAKGARRIADRQRKTRLSLDQIRELGRAMREARAEGESPTGLAAIRLLLLTGFRRGEALGLRPSWILPAGGVDFPDTKSGPQVRPIGRTAVGYLQEITDRAAQWVFPSDHGEGHFVGVPKVLARVCVRAGIKGITPHALRHTFASIAAELGFSELIVAGLLGHTAGSVTTGYIHLDSALVSAADRVSATIARALDGEASAEIIALRDGIVK